MKSDIFTETYVHLKSILAGQLSRRQTGSGCSTGDLSAGWPVRTLLVSFIYLAAIVLFFHVYSDTFSTSLIGPPEDNMQDFWNTWYSQKKLDNGPAGFFYTRDIFYPEGTSLFYHSFSYPNLAFMYLLRRIAGLGSDINTLVFLHNLFLLISFYCGALGAYFLTRLFVRSETLAVISGFIFGFSPFHVAHTLHHMHVGAITFVPFFVYFFLRYLRERKNYLALLAAVLWGLSALSCWYYLFYIGYFVLFYYVFHAVRARSPLGKELLLPITAITAAVAVLLLPFVIPMIGETGASSYSSGHNTSIADLLGFVTFHPYHLLSRIGEPVYSHFQGNYWEMTVYLGLVNAIILLLALFRKYYRRIENLDFCLACLLLFMLFSLGSFLHVAGQMTYVPLPTLLTQIIPFAKNVRTPSRAVIFVYLFTGISVAMIVEYYLAGRKRAVVLATLCFLAVFTFADFYPARLESTPVICPSAYALINADPDHNCGIVNIPVDYLDNNRYMMYQAACSPRPMAGGSVSRKTDDPALVALVDLPDLAAQKDIFKQKKIKYIMVHKMPLDQTVKQVPLTLYKEHYKLLDEDAGTALFQVY